MPLPGASTALSSAFTQASQSPPPLQCRPLFLLSLILFGKHTAQQSPLLVILQLSDPAAGEGGGGGDDTRLPGGQPPQPCFPVYMAVMLLLFLLLIHSLPFIGSGIGLSGRDRDELSELCLFVGALV